MRVQLDRQLHRLLQRLDQIIGDIRHEQPRHILHTDGVRPHLLDLFGVLHKIRDIVHRAGRIRHRHLHVRTLLPLGRLDGGLEIADVVERVENPDDIDPVRHGFLYKIFHHIVRIVPVAKHILPAEQHLQRGLRHVLFQGAQPLPRVLVQKPQARVKRRPAPAFERPIADIVQQFQRRQHLLSRHAGGDQRLMGVPQHGLRNSNLCQPNPPLFTAAPRAACRNPPCRPS